MAGENELTIGTDVNVELDELVVTGLEKSLLAQLGQLKLPAAFVKQELGVELDPRVDMNKVKAWLKQVQENLTTAVDQALRSGQRQATVSLPAGNKMKEFTASAEQLATLRKAVDEQLLFLTQRLQDFSGSKVGKLVADLRSGKRQKADFNPAELAELEHFASYLGELGQQISAFARNSRALGRKVTQPLDKETYASLNRIPLILEEFARIGTRLGTISKALPRVVDKLAEAEQALEQQQARARIIKTQAQAYVRAPDEQRALVRGLSESELDAGRRTIQDRLRQLGEAQARGVDLSAQEADEFARLRTAGQFVKREQQQRARAATGYYDQDSEAARNKEAAAAELRYAAEMRRDQEAARRQAQAEAARQARAEEVQRQRRQRELEDAFQKRSESLRFADVALTRAAARPLPDLNRDDRDQLRAQLVSEAASLRRLQRGQGDTEVDQAVTGRLAEIRAFLNQIAQLKDEERKLAAQQLAAQREATAKAKSVARADEAYQGRQVVRAAVGSNALQAIRGVAGGDFTLLSQADRQRMQAEVRRGITELEKFRKGLADGDALAEQSKENIQELQTAAAKLAAATRAFRTSKDLDSQLRNLENSQVGLRRNALAAEIQRVGGLQNLQSVAPELQTQLPGYLRQRRDALTAQLGQAQRDNLPTDGIRRELGETTSALEKLTAAGKRNLTTMQQLGQVFQTFFKYALGYGALYQLIGAVSALSRGVVDLEAKLSEIKGVAGLTNGEMRQVATSIETVAGKYAFSVDQISEATLTLAQAGVEMKDIGTTLDSVGAFATATGSNLQQAADLITSIKDVYEQLDPSTIANLLTQAVNISKLTGSDLQTIIGLSAGVAKSFNLSAEQYLAAVSALRNAGLKASTVATGLRQTLLEIFNPDDKLLKVLQQRYQAVGEKQSQADIKAKFFGFSQGDNGLVVALNELERLGLTGSARQQFEGAFDIRSRNVIEALSRNRGSLSSFEAQLGAGNATSISAAENLMNVKGALQQVRNEALLLSNQLTEGLLPGLREFLNGLADFMANLRHLDEDLKAGGGSGLGSVLGTTVVPAGILGALATRGGFLSRLGAFAGYGLGAGGAAIAGTAGASALGANSQTAEVIGSALGLALPSALGKVLSRLGGARTAGIVAEGGAAAVGGFAGKLAELFPLFTRLTPLVAATGPLGLLLGGLATVLAGAGIVRALSGATPQEQFNAATDKISAGAADFQATRKAEQEYSGQITGAGTELRRLEDEAQLLNKKLGEYFGGSAADIADVNELLQQVYKDGLDASGQARKDIVAKLNARAKQPISDEVVNHLSRLSSEVEAQSTAIVENAAREYERIAQLGEKAGAQDKNRAKAFDETFNAAFRSVQDNPASAGPALRLQAIRAYYDRIKEIEAESAKTQRAALEKQLAEANRLFAQAAASDPLSIGDRARTIVDLVGQLGGDVVAVLDQQIEELEKSIEQLRLNYRNDPTADNKERLDAGEAALARQQNRRRIEFEGRTSRNTAVGQDEARRIENLKAATEQARTYGLTGQQFDDAEALLKRLQAGEGVQFDDRSKIATQVLTDEVARSLSAVTGENDRARRGRENTEAVRKARAEVKAVVDEAAEQARLQKVSNNTKTLSNTAEALGLDPTTLQGDLDKQIERVIAAGDSGTTAVDKSTEALIRRAQFELGGVQKQIANLEKEGQGGDAEKNAKAIDLIKGKEADLSRKIQELKGKRDEKNAELVQKALTQLADKYEDDGKKQLAATKKGFDDAVTAGDLTAAKLEQFAKAEQDAIDQLERAFRAKLLGQDQYVSKAGILNSLGESELEKFRLQNRAEYRGVAGAKGAITSEKNRFEQRVADIETLRPEDDLARQRRITARGSDYAENELQMAIDRQQAKADQLAGITQDIERQREHLASIDASTKEGARDSEGTTQALALLTKEQATLLKDLDALTAKAESLNGSIKEELGQIADELSPAAFRERADLGTEDISKGFGSALETTINGIGDALVDATKKGRDFKTEMKSLAVEVGDALAKMLAREGVKQLLAWIVGGIGSLFGGEPSLGNNPVSSDYGIGSRNANTGWTDIGVARYAQGLSGGTISGPSGTDVIPGVVVDANGKPQRRMMVTAGESILTTKATKLMGRKAIDLLNRGEVPVTEQAAAMSQNNVVTNTTVGGDYNFDIPVTLPPGETESSAGINSPQLRTALRSAVVTVIEEQKRPGGALYRRN